MSTATTKEILIRGIKGRNELIKTVTDLINDSDKTKYLSIGIVEENKKPDEFVLVVNNSRPIKK